MDLLMRGEELFQFFFERHSVLRAVLGNGKRGGGTCLTDGSFDALIPEDGQRAVECVAGAGGVGSVHFKAGNITQTVFPVFIDRAFVAHGHQDGAGGF